MPDPLSDLRRVLACAALCPDLSSVLVIGADGGSFGALAGDFESLLADALGGPVDRARLGPSTTEDDLWGFGGDLPVGWSRRGLLIPPDSVRARLILISDLARLSLAASRAVVTVAGAPAAHLERHGQTRVLAPRLSWLAACAKEDLGAVSPHLLDRFALRIPWQERAAATPEDRREDLARRLRGDREPTSFTAREDAPISHGSSAPARAFSSDTGASRGAGVAARAPTLLPEALEEVIRRVPPGRAGIRREVSLARTGRALAQMDAGEAVTCLHIAEAARLLSLAPPLAAASTPVAGAPAPDATSPSVARVEPREGAAPVGIQPVLSGPASTPGGSTSLPVAPPEALPPVALPAPAIEEEAPVHREHASLRLPLHHERSSALGRGAIVGVRATGTLRDLAPASTLIAAMPHQPRRRAKAGLAGTTRLLLRRSDLRSYTRAPIAEEIAVLLLDYTATRGLDWQSALAPHLFRAYTERSRLCLILVGADGADPLRAERVEARSLLAPEVALALSRAPGRSTPLADGFALALAFIRSALHHGRSAARRVRFVALTDGRGNVPIEASRTGRIQGRVTREGADDARRIAEEIGAIQQVESTLLHPDLPLLATLPRALATALHATIERLPRTSP